VEPAGADVLDAGIDLRRQVGERSDRFVGEVEGHLLGRQQRHVLADQAVLRLFQAALPGCA
jgi:hypothetical protein